MAYDNKPGQGVMFPNDQQGNPNRPSWRGSVNIEGKEWELSAWEKVSRSGNRYLSIEAREPRQFTQQQGGYQQPQQNRQGPSYHPQQQRPAPQNYRQGNTPMGDEPSF